MNEEDIPFNFDDLVGGETRADQIFRTFRKFHLANPEVWKLFVRFTFDIINRGHSHYSSYAVFHRIRWHTQIDTGGEEIKLSNNITPYYARLFHIAYPEHGDFFINRTLTTENKPAHDSDEQFFISPLAGSESALKAKLAELLPNDHALRDR